MQHSKHQIFPQSEEKNVILSYIFLLLNIIVYFRQLLVNEKTKKELDKKEATFFRLVKPETFKIPPRHVDSRHFEKSNLLK